jgi:molybdate transport system substrate-binding protein
MAAAFEKRHPSTRIELILAGSQVLRTQIEHGAPAAVFASADLAHADALRRAGLLYPYEVFARNRLVAVVPASAAVAGLRDLARPGTKIVVAAASVPAGRYTSELLASLPAAHPDGAELAKTLRANVVSEETNVRAVLSKVVLGEADAGFVYATDVAAAREVRAVPLPEAGGIRVEYAIGVVARRPRQAEAQAFCAFVRGEEGQAVLRRFGFEP